MKKRSKQTVFFWAAIWNLVFGVTMLSFSAELYQLFFAQELPESAYHLRLFFNTVSFSIIIFGIGYYLVSRDPAQNHAVIWMGVIGKNLLFLLFLNGFIDGQITVAGFFGAGGDFAWALVFLYVLYQSRAAKDVNDN